MEKAIPVCAHALVSTRRFWNGLTGYPPASGPHTMGGAKLKIF